MELSKRQQKAADQVGGIQLMIPWPPDLQDPGPMPDSSARPATDAERAWLERDLQPACQAANLVLVRGIVARSHGPHPDGPRQQTRLGAIIIGRRWVAATGAPPPRIMWVTP